ncbi:MAG: DUF5989 family protein [Planctomycetota bacterium]
MPTNTPNESDDLPSLIDGKHPGILKEFWLFLRYNKKWWLLPLILSLLAVGLIGLLAGGPAGPFIYTLF